MLNLKRKRQSKYIKAIILLAICLILGALTFLRYLDVSFNPITNYYGVVMRQADVLTYRDADLDTLYCYQTSPHLFDVSSYCFDTELELIQYEANTQ